MRMLRRQAFGDFFCEWNRDFLMGLYSPNHLNTHKKFQQYLDRKRALPTGIDRESKAVTPMKGIVIAII